MKLDAAAAPKPMTRRSPLPQRRCAAGVGIGRGGDPGAVKAARGRRSHASAVPKVIRALVVPSLFMMLSTTVAHANVATD